MNFSELFFVVAKMDSMMSHNSKSTVYLVHNKLAFF